MRGKVNVIYANVVDYRGFPISRWGFGWPRFAAGTKAVADAVARADAFSVVGGADSIRALNELGLTDQVSWASTGGGAALELLEGKQLPGVAVIPAA